MKPGNLLIQGAKSVGKREMRIRYSTHRVFGVCIYFLCVKGTLWKRDYLLLNV